MKFEKATRKKAKLRLALTAPSGGGKTYGALMLAKGLGGKVALIDTEHASASLYTHLLDFDTMNLTAPYSPRRYIDAIHTAEQAGYDVLIIDSITHEWSGSGGCLELVDEFAKSKFKGNTWSAWSEVTPLHRELLETLLHSPMHIIVTMRSKTETAQTEENGRKKVVKLGMKAEQRDGFEYEMTVVLDLVHDGHYANVTKDRTGLFKDGQPKPIDAQTGAELLAWLNSGGEAERTLRDVSDNMIASYNRGDIAGAYGEWEAVIENDDKTTVWGYLKEHSELRAKIKEAADSARAAAAQLNQQQE